MSKSHYKLGKTIARLATDSPVVIAARVARMCQPGAALSASDQAEFARMILEKQAAAMESWWTMSQIAARQFQSAWFGDWLGRPGKLLPSPGRQASALNAALRPYRKRASANARRLGRKK